MPQTLSVLVVDDSPEVRMLTRIALEVDGGFRVVGEAVDGSDAIDLAGERQPDLILLDLAMPGVDGLTAIAELRERSPGSVVVVVSALGAPRLPSAVLDRGAHAFIHKGGPPRQLIARLRDALARASGPGAGPESLPSRTALLHRLALALDAADTPFAVLHVGVEPRPSAERLVELIRPVAEGGAVAPFVALLDGGDLAVLVGAEEAEGVAEAVVAALGGAGAVAVGVATSAHRRYTRAEDVLAVAAEMRRAEAGRPESGWRTDRRAPAPRIAAEPR